MSSLTRLRVLLARVVSGSLAPAETEPIAPERVCA
jgi:hypothetical protein